MNLFKKTFYICILSLIGCLLFFGRLQAQKNQSGESALRQVQTSPARVDSMIFSDMKFRTVGPTRGGRVTAVEGHPAHPQTFYMGAAGGGGVWRTDNYGQTWKNISDGNGFKSTSIGAIQVADSDTSIIYVGTGTDGIRANVTTGQGIYKSTDAGKNWQYMGLKNAGQIGSIEVHPKNPDLVYAAALGDPFGSNPERGVFRSKDGGQAWEKVLFASDTTGAIDLELNPEYPSEIYAALWRAERKPWTIISGAAKENGLYKSTDGGDTWNQMSKGLPQGLTGKADFAVTPADPDRIYALLEAPGDQQGLYRSDDRGESWRQMSDTTGIMSRPFYFTNITAHPTHPDTVYVGNVRYWVSFDGGKTFKRRPVSHADVHDLWINPENPKVQVQGNDGGATVTLDGGKTWSTQLNQPTAELYQVNLDNRFPYWLYAGQQDNTTIAVPSLPPAESAENPQGLWHMTGGCETGPAVPNLKNPAVVYANCKGRFGAYNFETGQEKQYWVGAQYMYGRNPAELEYRFQRVAPIEVSPHDSSVVYHGSQYVHRSDNGGASWTRISPDLTANKPQYQVVSGTPINRDVTGEEHYSTLYSIQVSPHSRNVIWAGSNDGPVHVTRDGGKSWMNVTPGDLPPNGRVDAIEPSPRTPGTAYIAVQRRLLDDFHPYIYRTSDFGKTWKLLTTGNNGIPADHPARVVREDPDRKGLLYAGTDYGVFVSFDDGANWQPLRHGLPVTPVTDIRVHKKDLVLSTMGRGFWILDNLTVLHQLSDRKMAGRDHHLFKPRDAYRMRYRSRQYDARAPEYVAPGAMIDFYLAKKTDSPIMLEILKQDGSVVRRFKGMFKDTSGPGQKSDAGRNMSKPDSQTGTADSLRVRRGHNRFIWDLRYPGRTIPASDNSTYFGAGTGPLATPGMYRIRLSSGEWSAEEPFRLHIDPRVRASGVTNRDLTAQLDLNLDIRNAIGQARRAAAEIDSLRSRISDAAGKDESADSGMQPAIKELDRLHARLVTSEEGSYMPPMLIDQLQYLYSMTTSADQHPGEDAFTRYEELNKDLNVILQEWERKQEEIELSAKAPD